MKTTLAALLLLTCLHIVAQQTPHRKENNYWSVGINPFGIVENEAALGPCISYRLLPHLEFWTEYAFLFNSFNSIGGWHNLSGYRFIFQPRLYFTKSSSFFIAPEFRLKHYTYNSTGNFINSNASDTLLNYPHNVLQTLIGGALLIGSQGELSRKHQIFLEFTIGIGYKERMVKRENVPVDYTYFYQQRHYAFTIDYEKEGNLVYIPLCLRLICKLR